MLCCNRRGLGRFLLRHLCLDLGWDLCWNSCFNYCRNLCWQWRCRHCSLSLSRFSLYLWWCNRKRLRQLSGRGLGSSFSLHGNRSRTTRWLHLLRHHLSNQLWVDRAHINLLSILSLLLHDFLKHRSDVTLRRHFLFASRSSRLHLFS